MKRKRKSIYISKLNHIKKIKRIKREHLHSKILTCFYLYDRGNTKIIKYNSKYSKCRKHYLKIANRTFRRMKDYDLSKKSNTYKKYWDVKWSLW